MINNFKLKFKGLNLKKNALILTLIFCSVYLFADNYKTKQDANMRVQPDVNSEVVATLTKGTMVDAEISNENPNWYKVAVNGKTGYVHKSLIEKPSLTIWEILIAIVMFVIIFNVIKRGHSTKCPKCKKLFAEKTLRKEFEGSDGHYETKTYEDKVKNRNGKVIGTTERQAQVHMTTEYFRNYCKCRYCGYEYNYQSHKTFEG